jgi:hypothetical protein
MSKRDYHSDSGSELRSAITAVLHEVESRSVPSLKLPDYFVDLVRSLQDVLPIERAFLAVRELSGTRLVATATFGARKVRKNLNLRIPAISSLFRKVSEGGIAFTDNCGTTVGMLGMSSEQAEAFSVVDEGLLDSVVAKLARRVVSDSPQLSTPATDQLSEPLF